MSRQYRVTRGAMAHAVDIRADGSVVVDATTFVVTPAGPHRYLVTRSDGRRDVVSVAGEISTPWVGAGGFSGELSVRSPAAARTTRKATSESDMTAPMPAKVVSIAAPVGATVVTGDPVVVLEAMKMTLTIRAPRNGVIKSVRCQPGDLVKSGAILAELDG